MRRIAVVAAFSILLASCASETGGYKAPAGTLLGGALGGLAGSQIGGGSGRLAATAGGALLGAFIGNQAGQSLDRADYTYRQQRYSGIPQQVPQPMPYYAAPPAYYAAPPPYRPTAYVSNCQPLVSNNPWERAATACQTSSGGWQVFP